ncbi:MAG: hypothetical protein Q4C65_02315 [Eubacteriales bacterium]|nr:hypothetical protein [Eubacteriales bacterium]
MAKKRKNETHTPLESGPAEASGGPDSARRPVPGEYLDNPLPVPKRHVKREMDYGFEPAPEQMYYEIPVADNDDFDV